MLILRIVAVLVAIGIGASVFAFIFTRERRYLELGWRLFRYAIIVALLVLERVLVPFVPLV